MSEEGVPPGYQVVQALGECHRQFTRLRHDLTRRAEGLGLPVPPAERLAGLNDLGRVIEALGECPPPSSKQEPPRTPPIQVVAPDPPAVQPVATAPAEPEVVIESPAEASERGETPASPVLSEPVETTAPEAAGPVEQEPMPAPSSGESPAEPVRQKAIEVLDRLLQLSSRDATVADALDTLLGQARVLRDGLAATSVEELPADAGELARGEHAYCELLTAVGGMESLGDAEWAALHARVSLAFGRPLAVAAARGKLGFRA